LVPSDYLPADLADKPSRYVTIQLTLAISLGRHYTASKKTSPTFSL